MTTRVTRTGIPHRRDLPVAGMLALLVLAGCPAAAQTWSCAADSLRLVSPATVAVELTLAGDRAGINVRWPDLDDAESACAALLGAESLGYSVALSGDYADEVDRELVFIAQTSGIVGTQTRNRVSVIWNNAFVARSGNINGEINLSNSGGIWNRAPGAGEWVQRNEGIPNYLAYTNVVAMAITAGGGGGKLVALSSGSTPTTTSSFRGVYLASGGGDYTRVGAGTLTDGTGVLALALDPGSNQRFAVGTATLGLFVTSDGGATFTQWRRELDPGAPSFPVEYAVTALAWTDARLYVAVRTFGLFYSEDDGASFQRLGNLQVRQNLDSPTSPLVVPEVLRFQEDPSAASHVSVGLRDHAAYHTPDLGANWLPLAASLTVVIPGTPNAWRYSGGSLYHDPRGASLDDDLYVLGTTQKGLWRTLDGGATWTRVGQNVLPQDVSVTAPVNGLVADPSLAGGLLAAASNLGLLVSPDQGATWNLLAERPNISTVSDLVAGGDGTVHCPTFGGGVFVPGRTIRLSSTILRAATDDQYDNLELGLFLTFGAGQVESLSTFQITAQDFQGWIVWRSLAEDPTNMQILGKFDKTNPETCIEGFCGGDFSLIPNCFSERRAACFRFDTPGEILFYDGDVYNAFTYYYAVTTFDYGNTAGVAPASLTSPMVFSPRFTGDSHSPFTSAGNRAAFQVNLAAQPAADGPEIFAYPNPLRTGAGFPGGEGDQVVFSNLPPESRVRIYSLAGDEVADLGPDQQVGANTYWQARNPDGQDLASGVYIWKVEMRERGAFWGKLVVIR